MSDSIEIPRLHVLVSERQLESAVGLETAVRVLERAGPVAVHLRARVEANRLYEAARRLAERAGETRGWLVVNGRPDIALAASAHGVQLGRGALSIGETKRIAGAGDAELRIGASVHGVREAEGAADDGADYLVLGTIHPTPSHPGTKGEGPEIIRATADRVSIPILAIGGVGIETADEAMAAGAYGAVVASAVWDRTDPPGAARELRETLDAAAEDYERT
ncbi:MAG: thiamine phosphate synthase [Gemmatimonadetes bacterium]|nr:thiamine phosphate synthase [Gemmatimonadota bacterium]